MATIMQAIAVPVKISAASCESCTVWPWPCTILFSNDFACVNFLLFKFEEYEVEEFLK
jgi:hypothetical protein